MPQPTREEIQQKMTRKFGKRTARTGGKGSLRRKFKAHPKSSTQDDKRLNSSLKKLNVSSIPAIEEVNLFKDDNTVVHFNKPRVQAEIGSNTYVVSGNCETKKLDELIPQIIPQLGSEHIESLKTFGRTFNALLPQNEEEEEVVPTLVADENFEDIANADEKKNDNDNTEKEDDNNNKNDNNDNNDNNNNDRNEATAVTNDNETQPEQPQQQQQNESVNDGVVQKEDNNNSNNNNEEVKKEEQPKKENEDNDKDENIPDLVPQTKEENNDSNNNNNVTTDKNENKEENNNNNNTIETLEPDKNQAVDV